MIADGDVWKLAHMILIQRGPASIKITKVKGHATDVDVLGDLDKQEQKEGGPWKGNSAGNFYGWEANKIVAVTSGESIMELITRAQTRLCVVLVEGMIFYEEIKDYLHQAADCGLIEMQNVDTDDSVWKSMWNRAKLLMKTRRKAV